MSSNSNFRRLNMPGPTGAPRANNGGSGGGGGVGAIFLVIVRLILWLILAAVIVVVLYIAGMGVYYLIDPCVNKKPFFEFLVDFTWQSCRGNAGQPQDEMEANLDKAEREILREKEVFHISDQIYNYQQAQHKCAAYGARLATKAEITEAYNKGANWCSYGWSEGQNAYYPIQANFWKRLLPWHRDDCGRPGVNGGRFPEHIRFGANCFGVKPAGEVVIPKNPWEDNRAFCDRPENKDACQKEASDEISPFNPREWSMFK